MLIYVDESGDLGWSLDKPYGRGGSSRYLTIAAMCAPDLLDHLPRRKIRELYRYGKWDTKREKKWVEMPSAARVTFAKNAANLKDSHPSILYKAIVADKRNTNPSFRRDSNKLYNYMIKLLLLEEMKLHPNVTLIPDPRSIKIENGNNLHRYLEQLLYEEEAETNLETLIRNSKDCSCLQFTDMLAGVIGTHFEFGKLEPFGLLSPHVLIRKLFF